jgi:flap endonuclease-1
MDESLNMALSHFIQLANIRGSTVPQVAIDASMSIYQFLIAVRSEGNQLQNEAGETTSHLMGMFYRTVRMVDNGIKPVYVSTVLERSSPRA